eukprot:SAG25_NODE_625_length_6379_cov_111.932803_8_plen_40_part_00
MEAGGRQIWGMGWSGAGEGQGVLIPVAYVFVAQRHRWRR